MMKFDLIMRGVSSARCFVMLALQSLLYPCLVFAQDAVAQEAVQPVRQITTGERLLAMTPMFVMVFFIFYFMVLRPQKKQIEDHSKLIGSLKPGDSVVTNSGIVGKVSRIEKEFILLEVANNVKIKVLTEYIKNRLNKQKQAGK